MIGLDQTATVYTPHPTTGEYTVLAKSGLPCRLVVVSLRMPNSTAEERADPATDKVFLWGTEYTMPGNAQVSVSGARYNIMANTVTPFRNHITSVYQRALVEVAL